MTKSFEALASGETLEIRVYGAIGGGMFFGGVTAEQVADAIKYNAGFKRIVLKINSPGGNAFEGMAIRSILASQEVETIAEIEGLAASAGSIAALGCKTVRMHIGTAMMIHEARGSANEPLDSKKLKNLADALETLNDGMASLYAKRTGLSKKKCRELMADETWLTADRAVKDGFADEIIDGDNEAGLKVAASFDLTKFGYQHVPQQFRASEGPGEVPPPAPEEQPAKKPDEKPADDTQPVVPVEEPQPSLPQVSPPSAAMTAEASAARKRLDTMTIKLIATAAGLSADADESAVVAAVSQLHAFVGELKTLTKSESAQALLGAIRGLQASAEQVPVLAAKVDEQAKQLEAQERAAILAADKASPEGRRVTPHAEKWLETQSLDVLKGYIANTAPVVVVQQGGQQQPALKQTSASAPSAEPVAHNGKTWEQLAPIDLHNLKVSGPEGEAAYEALLANYVERGRPARAQSQQQREGV
jgi:ATP-dependent Clp protease protease subunit